MKTVNLTEEEHAELLKLRANKKTVAAEAMEDNVVRAKGGTVAATWSDAAREASAEARRGHTRDGDSIHEGMDVRATPKYGGKAGRVTGWDSDKSFIKVKHDDGSHSSYHHSDLHTHYGDEDDPNTRASDWWKKEAVRAAGTSEGAVEGWKHRQHGDNYSVGEHVRVNADQHDSHGEEGFVTSVRPRGGIGSTPAGSPATIYHVKFKDRAGEMFGHGELMGVHHPSSGGFIKKASADVERPVEQRDEAMQHGNRNAGSRRRSGSFGPMASDTTTTDIVHCRASSAAGEKLGASSPWKPGEQVQFMWMPAGVSTICAGFRRGSIELTVNCDEATAEAVQASLENWRNERPKQEPFGCVEHREQEASFRISASGGFKWNGDGVYLAAEPTTLGAQNVNGKVHRSWSPSFTTDADYSKATEHDGVLQFPEGVRGSRSNPAQITGVDFCVGTLTNKPAFHSMSPVRSREAVMASGTSEGVRKSWQKRTAGGLSISSIRPSQIADTTGDKEHHLDAAMAHFNAHIAHVDEGNDEKADFHNKQFEHHAAKAGVPKHEIDRITTSIDDVKGYMKKVAKATDATPASAITAHCKENLLRDVPDATKAEIACYEKCIDDGGAHSDAVYEIRKERKNGFVSSNEKPTLDSIFTKVNASLTTANQLAEKNGACKLTAQEVYERHCAVQMSGPRNGGKVMATWSDAARRASAEARRLSEEADAVKNSAANKDAFHHNAAEAHLSAMNAHKTEGNEQEAAHHESQMRRHQRKATQLRGYNVYKSSEPANALESIYARAGANR